MVPFVLLGGRYVPIILHVLFNRLLKHFDHIALLNMGWDCRVSILNRLQVGQAKNYGLIPGMSMTFFFLQIVQTGSWPTNSIR